MWKPFLLVEHRICCGRFYYSDIFLLRKYKTMKKPKRLSKKQLQEDRDAYAALKAITDYNPSNKEYALDEIINKHETMNASQTDEVQKEGALDAARDKTAADEWEFHNAILGSKQQVIAQFGDSSDEVQSVGLKKKSEYKRPTGRKPSEDSGKD